MENKELTRSQRFVAAVLARCREDKGFAARLRRADNPDTEHYAYGLLVAFGIALERDGERRAHALIGASLSRGKREQDGTLGLGEALRRCVRSKGKHACGGCWPAAVRRRPAACCGRCWRSSPHGTCHCAMPGCWTTCWPSISMMPGGVSACAGPRSSTASLFPRNPSRVGRRAHATSEPLSAERCR